VDCVVLTLEPDLGNASAGTIVRLLLLRLLIHFYGVSSYFLREGYALPVVNLSLQILPVVEEEKIYPLVDQVIEIIQASGLKYVVGPMETTIEGELDSLLDLVKKAQEVCVQGGASRVISVVKIDYKPDGVTMDEKTYKYR